MRAGFALLFGAFGVQTALWGAGYTLVVFHPGPHAIDEIDPSTGKILHQLTVENQPHEAVITPDRKTMYVSLPNPGVVVVIDAATLTQTGKIESQYFKAPPHPQGRKGQMTTSTNPHAIAISNDGSKLYVGLSWAEHPGVAVYDLKAGKDIKKIDLPAPGEFMKMQARTGRLLVPTREGVVVIDTKADSIVTTIPVKGAPTGVDFAKNGEAWTSENGDGTVTVIDTKKNEIVKTIQTSGKGSGRMAVSPDGKWAAATHNNTEDVVIFDVAKKETAGTVQIGKGPSLPVFSPDSSKLFVMTAGGPCSEACPGSVVVIDPKEAKVTARYKVDDDAFAVVVSRSGK
jgi:DNA-binding beta-propeller fold protein YncE